jgi:hypothetical protein
VAALVGGIILASFPGVSARLTLFFGSVNWSDQFDYWLASVLCVSGAPQPYSPDSTVFLEVIHRENTVGKRLPDEFSMTAKNKFG